LLERINDTHSVRCNIIESTTCWVLVGVPLVVAIDFSHRVELWADVGAVISNGAVQVDSKFVVSACFEISEVDLHHRGFVGVLGQSDSTRNAVVSGARHVTDCVLVLFDVRIGFVRDGLG